MTTDPIKNARGPNKLGVDVNPGGQALDFSLFNRRELQSTLDLSTINGILLLCFENRETF